MKFRTFYRLFYKHRLQKASKILTLYILLILPFRYLINSFYFEKKINLDNFSIKNAFLFEKNLNYLFEFFNSDKGDFFINQYVQPIRKDKKQIKGHGYSKFYDLLFSKIKNKSLNIVELGSFYGNASAALFFYFKKSIIYGGDINPDMFKYKSNRVKNFFINNGSRSSIEKNLLNSNINFDIIIEDGSHKLKDQIISLFMLFPILNSSGYFVTEEIDFPESKEDMRINQSAPDLKTILKNVKEKKDFKSIYIQDFEKKYFIENFESINFYKGNLNEIVVIKKK